MGNINDMESVGSTAKVNILVGYDIDPSQAPGVSGLNQVHFIKVVHDTNASAIKVDGDPANVSFPRNGYNSADPVNLLAFINWAQTSFPATRNALVLWDHGDGWLPGWKGASSLRRWQTNRGASGMLGDDHDGSQTSLTDNAYIAQTLNGKHFDLLCFDACNMAHIEALYDYRGLADWISASEALMPGLGYPYGAILSAWNSAALPSAQAVAKIIADETYNFYNNNEYVCQATINTAALAPLTAACADLAAEVTPKGGTEAPLAQQAIANAFAPELGDGEADLRGFFEAYRGLTTDLTIQAKLDTALNAYDAAVVYFRQYLLDQTTGITAYLPSGTYFSQGYQDMYLSTAFNTATDWLGMLQTVEAPPVAWVPGDKIEISWVSTNADMDLAITDPGGHFGGPWNPAPPLNAELDFSADNPSGGGTTEWAKLKTGAPTGEYAISVGFNDYSGGAPPATYNVTVKLYNNVGTLKHDFGVCTVPHWGLVDFAILKYTL